MSTPPSPAPLPPPPPLPPSPSPHPPTAAPPPAVTTPAAVPSPPPPASNVTGPVQAASEGRICFNTSCKEPLPEVAPRRKGWRLRSGDCADLCERCCSTYEQGAFCETFHSDVDGWRKCGSCSKRVHCGCIVSYGSFMLLDGGGMECSACAQKHIVLGSSQAWQPPIHPLAPERPRDTATKSWGHLNSTGSIPGQWRHTNSWSVKTAVNSELHRRLSYEFDRPNSIEKLFSGVTSMVSDPQKHEDLPERQASHTVNKSVIDKFVGGNSGMKPSAYSGFHREDGTIGEMQNSSHVVGNNNAVLTRKVVIQGSRISNPTGSMVGAIQNACGSVPIGSPILKGDSAPPVLGIASPFLSSIEVNNARGVHPNQSSFQNPQGTHTKQLFQYPGISVDSGRESQTQMRNGKPKVEGRGRNHLLPRYWPRISDVELQKLSGDSNSVITPLFEKVLSASDAGRIGRLVLPKRCAEAYFPSISHPEGLPLKVQDTNGNEWVFQFRFWPNNNSRMYVLEGVTPCIQSMQLQAGDTVTFSRIDPEGKLVMGFRKASNLQTAQPAEGLKTGNGFSSTAEVNNKNSNQVEVAVASNSLKCSSESVGNVDDSKTLDKDDKATCIPKEGLTTKSSVTSTKRKGSALGSKNKRLCIESEDSIELKLTWEEAQGLLRPPPNYVPSTVVIEGHEFEEYEDPPVLGKPTIFISNQLGGKDQWAQCEDCSKWRKLPVNAMLPLRWTCLDNTWDPERSSCASVQELSGEKLAELLASGNVKKSKTKVEADAVEGSSGLDTLANLAILGEGAGTSTPAPPTTRHPRHRPGCTCIVCIQPPSGKGPKHKQTCTCNVCLTVKRRFRTLMLRKEKRQSEKEVEPTGRKPKKKKQMQPPEDTSQPETNNPTSKISSDERKSVVATNDALADENHFMKEELMSVKTEIDLNMQPEREEEPQPLPHIDARTSLPNNTSS